MSAHPTKARTRRDSRGLQKPTDSPVHASRVTPASAGLIEFMQGWVTRVGGALQPGGELVISYDPARLVDFHREHNAASWWALSVSFRFQPGGQHGDRTVVEHVPGEEPGAADRSKPVASTITIPADASHLEVWFRWSDGSRLRWDSHFGANYRFPLGPRVPPHSVSARDARRSLEMVNVLADGATKTNAFPTNGGQRAGVDYETNLNIEAWVRNVEFRKSVWADVHVFDEHDQVVHAETIPLAWIEAAGGHGDRFAFKGIIYQGSTATPGSVAPRSNARLVQYRLYYEVDGTVYTDGVLHQHEVQRDAVTQD